MTEIQSTKEQITDVIITDKNFKNILNSFKTDITSAFSLSFNNEAKNGLVDKIFGITVKDELLHLIVPVFSTEKTITWNFSYFDTILEMLPKEYQDMETHILKEKIICPLYFYDKITGDAIFLSLVKLSDWINNGLKGKNGYSVYYWNDKLPNKDSMTKKDLTSYVFTTTLPFLKDKEIKKICDEYATKSYAKFANESNRSSQTIIKNIATGLYAQIKVYLYLLENGYEVRMEWADGDDLGIDIQYFTHNTWINIDVKSTKTDDLKISKNRKETDFYAVCSWDKSNPILLGFLFKYDFWKSDLTKSKSPEKKDDMWFKTLKDIKKDMTDIDNIYSKYHNYQIQRMKRNERLFNEQ